MMNMVGQMTESLILKVVAMQKQLSLIHKAEPDIYNAIKVWSIIRKCCI